MRQSVMGWLTAGIFALACGAMADVISVSFGTDKNNTAVSGSEQVGLVEGVIGDAWNNLTGNNGTDVPLRTSDNPASDDLTATWTSANLYSYTDGITDDLIKDYLDDGNTVSITIDGIPFYAYDVVIYTASDNNDVQFSPISVNGILYRWDDTLGDTVATADSVFAWGISRHPVAAYGINAIRVKGRSGSMCTIKTPARGANPSTGKNFRSSIAAVQIVQVEEATYPGADFFFSGYGNEAPTGWITAWSGQGTSTRFRIGPESRDARATYDGAAPYHSSWTPPGEFTFSAVLDITDVDTSVKEAVLIDLGTGKSGSGNRCLLLLKQQGSSNVELAYCSNTSGTNGKYTKNYSVTVPDIPQGYHLYTITFSPASGFSLKVDDMDAVSFSGSLNALSGGFQLGDIHGGKNISVAASDMGFCSILGWSRTLALWEQRALYHDLRAIACGTPVLYRYSANFSLLNGTLTVPTMEADGSRYLGSVRGTMNIPATSTVSVPALRMMNESGTTNSFTMNLAGTVNVTSTSTGNNPYPERNNNIGILFGHWHGTATYNITGALVGENAYMETVYSCEKQTFNIDGGMVYVRGLCANNNNSVLNLSNGGSLIFADYAFGNIPLNCAQGTVSGYAYDGSKGWSYQGATTFNDTETGTTIDANGLTLGFNGTVTGQGKVIITDTSEDGGGSVWFTGMNGFTGTVMVDETGTIDIGPCRPESAFVFADGATFILCESMADENGYVNISFAGNPRVVMYRADGITPIEDAEVVTENGIQRIRFTPSDTPIVSGKGCWYDFEFDDYSLTSVGMNTSTLSLETANGIGGADKDANFKDDRSLLTASQVYMTIAYPTQWSAAIYATIPNYPFTTVMCFGTLSNGCIGLIAGEAENQVYLVRTTGNSPYEILASMSVPNAATCQHLYVFSKRSRNIDIYLDGVLWNTYTTESDITIGNGFQIASLHGSTGNTGIQRFGKHLYDNDVTNPELLAAYIGMLRIYDTALNSAALAALADEFPYVSPNGLYVRDLAGTGDAEPWSASGAWEQVSESGSEAVDAPAELAVLQINGTSAGDSILTVDLPADAHFEALTIAGNGSVRLEKGSGGTLINDGKTVISTDTVIAYGAATIDGGPLTINPGATLTFDYTAFPISPTTPNQVIQLTGNSSADAPISLATPDNTYERTFTLFFNEETSTWFLAIARPAYTLDWNGDADNMWDDETRWINAETHSPAGFIKGDTVNFPSRSGIADETIELGAPYNPEAVRFSAETTRYTLSGATLTTTNLVKSGTAAIILTNTVDLASGVMSIARGGAAFYDLRGTVGAATFLSGYGDDLALLGTADTVTIQNVVFGDGLDPVIHAAENATVTLASGAITLPYSETLRKTGPGALTITDGANFAGQLSVEEGTVTLNGTGLPSATATRENPVMVHAGATLRITPKSWAANEGGTFPNGSFVATDGGLIEMVGNNIFSRNPGEAPTFLISNGGTLQLNGANSAYDLRVEGIELNGGTIHIVGATANWNNRAAYLTGGKLISAGESAIVMDADATNRLDVEMIEVVDGTLTIAAPIQQYSSEAETPDMAGTIVKTGAGTLVLRDQGGAVNRIVQILAGTLRATEALTENIDTLYLANGTTLDLSELDDAFGGEAIDTQLIDEDLNPNYVITVELGNRQPRSGEKIIAWGATGELDAKFRCHLSDGAGSLVKNAEGVFFVPGGTLMLVR
ncbi:MAG: hypothetical protein J6334_14375 [Kiritimatiellae bacterium]|nr:hypothetical protein [Kiritimatiellia bacterium]